MRCFTAGGESAVKSCRKPLKRFPEWGRWKEVGGGMMLVSGLRCVRVCVCVCGSVPLAALGGRSPFGGGAALPLWREERSERRRRAIGFGARGCD